MEYRPEAHAPETSRLPPHALRRPQVAPRDDDGERPPRDDEPRSWRATRPNTILLAVEHLAIARQMTTFLWILSAALMYQSAALGEHGHSYAIAGLIVIGSAMLLGFVSHRRLHGTIVKWYVRDGMSEGEASKRASHDVERAHVSSSFREAGSDVRAIGSRRDR